MAGIVLGCAEGESISDDTNVPIVGAGTDAGTGGATASQSAGGASPATPVNSAGGALAIGGGLAAGGAAASSGGSAAPPTGGTAAPSAGGAPSGGAGGASPSGGAANVSTGGAAPAAGGAPPAAGGTPSTGGASEVDRCVAMTEDNACTRCVCNVCQTQSFACGDTGNPTRDDQCLAIVECGQANHCSSVACYCGTASLTDCAATPLGACKAQIQAAAGTTDFATIATDLTTADHPIFLANAVGDCAATNCKTECGL